MEERIAAARSVQVITAILSIELGSELDEAHEKLDPLCAPGTHPKSEGGDDEEKARDAQEHDAAGKKEGVPIETEHRPPQPKSGEEENEGHKVLWQLAGTDYSAVYIIADAREHITSITGFLRPGKEIPFEKVGEVAKAPVQDTTTVIWDVLRPDRPLFRVSAKGASSKANSITLFVVQRHPRPEVHHVIKPGSEPD